MQIIGIIFLFFSLLGSKITVELVCKFFILKITVELVLFLFVASRAEKWGNL